MTDINNLIHLNVEIEGLLRVMQERNSKHAKGLLADKYQEYKRRLEAFLAEPDEDSASALEQTATDLAAEATHIEVKDQEAESAEVEDETDAATAAIERGAEKFESYHEPEAPEVTPVAEPVAPTAVATPNQKILKAFTLNDKFRFRRNLFGGDDRAFDDTLAILADMPTYDDAADFIYNDMMLDPKNPDVVDFMAVLAECYPA